MPRRGGYKSDSTGCNEVHKRTAKYPLQSQGYQTGRVHFQVVSVSTSPHESLRLQQLGIFPARTNCLMTIVPPISESCLILHISDLQCSYWMLNDYVVFGPVFFSVNTLEKQFLTQKVLFITNVLDTSQRKEMAQTMTQRPGGVIRFLIKG